MDPSFVSSFLNSSPITERKTHRLAGSDDEGSGGARAKTKTKHAPEKSGQLIQLLKTQRKLTQQKSLRADIRRQTQACFPYLFSEYCLYRKIRRSNKLDRRGIAISLRHQGSHSRKRHTLSIQKPMIRSGTYQSLQRVIISSTHHIVHPKTQGT